MLIQAIRHRVCNCPARPAGAHILGAGAFDWDATRLTAAALALLVVSLCAQSVTLLIARGYYAAGQTIRPLLFALLSTATAVASAIFLIGLFHASPIWRDFLESLLRVADIPGTTVLMLALGYCLGALLQVVVGLYYFSRTSPSLRGLRRLMFECFGARSSGEVAYVILSFAGSYIDINTTVGIVSQGLWAASEVYWLPPRLLFFCKTANY